MDIKYCGKITAAIAMLVLPLAALAAGSVCYGDLATTCTPPATITVQQSDVIALPGVLWADADASEDRLAISVTLSQGTFARTPTLVGGGTIITSTANVVQAASDGPFALADIAVRGAFRPDSDIVAHVKLVNPNGATALLWQGDIVLAHVAPASAGELFAINPAANIEQQTFARITNIGDRTALVLLNPIDDTGAPGGEIAFFVGPGASRQINSADMERGNVDKGFVGGFGTGAGKWRVRLVADQPVRWQVFVRNMRDGTLSALSDPSE